LFICCSLLSILIGSVGALYQFKIKRMLAFSAVANLGFILLGLSNGSYWGLFASLYYFCIYILTLVQIFSILVAVRIKPEFVKIKNLVEFSTIVHVNPALSFVLVLGLLSLAGIPPLSGFYGKLSIFISLIDSSYYFLAVYAVLFSIVTCIYYIRLIRFM